jgi:hypothetical protein
MSSSAIHVCNRRAALAAALAILTVAAPRAFADSVSGSCGKGDTSVTFSDGVVFKAPNPFEETKLERTVVLTNVKLDKAALNGAEDMEDAVRNQVWEADDGARVQLSLDDENAVWALNYSSGGSSFSQSGTGVGELELSADDAKHLAGSFKLAADDADELHCDLTFDLAYGTVASAAASAPPPPKGTALPPGGGAIGAAYMKNFEAMRKGDVDTMIATAAKETADQMRAARKEPDFPQMLEFMKAFAPTSIKVIGGEDFGSTATLTLEGTDESGAKSTGTAAMAKEADGWKVVKTSMKSGG